MQDTYTLGFFRHFRLSCMILSRGTHMQQASCLYLRKIKRNHFRMTGNRDNFKNLIIVLYLIYIV